MEVKTTGIEPVPNESIEQSRPNHQTIPTRDRASGFYARIVKRLLDILFALMALPFLLLAIIFVAPLIWYSDRGTVFYNAPRLGYKGKIFTMYKFRSMKVNAPDVRLPDGSTYNGEDDPRQTKIGRFLRKTSLDELPQVINVLKGDMSFVGPRPDLPDATKLYRDSDFQKLDVKPGITGYAQAYKRNSGDLKQKFDFDVYYSQHINFVFDVKILLKTVYTVVLRKNIYREG